LHGALHRYLRTTPSQARARQNLSDFQSTGLQPQHWHQAQVRGQDAHVLCQGFLDWYDAQPLLPEGRSVYHPTKLRDTHTGGDLGQGLRWHDRLPLLTDPNSIARRHDQHEGIHIRHLVYQALHN
jgi:hypothetical protein